MKRIIYILCFCLSFPIAVSAQQDLKWNGNNNATDAINRTGAVTIGNSENTNTIPFRVNGHMILSNDDGGGPVLSTGTGTQEMNRYLKLINSPNFATASGLKVGGVLVSDSYAFANPGKNDLIVKGNTSIGTATPFAKLSVAGGKIRAIYNQGQTTPAQIDDINGDFGVGGIVENSGGDLHLRSWWGVVIDKNGGNMGEDNNYNNGVTPAGGTFAVRTRTSNTAFRTDFVIRYNGNVGIGTSVPKSLLAVNGKITAKEVVVTVSASAIPDYVFAKEYQLRPLFEVENYIKKYNHLPEVPSAAELEKGGLNLGEMDALLLKKIEELTLYMIEQDKKIKHLEEQLSKVNK